MSPLLSSMCWLARAVSLASTSYRCATLRRLARMASVGARSAISTQRSRWPSPTSDCLGSRAVCESADTAEVVTELGFLFVTKVLRLSSKIQPEEPKRDLSCHTRRRRARTKIFSRLRAWQQEGLSSPGYKPPRLFHPLFARAAPGDQLLLPGASAQRL